MTKGRRLATLLALLAATFLSMPLLWLVAGSLRLDGGGMTFSAYGQIFHDLPLAKWLLNGVVIAGTQTLLSVLTCSSAAYVLRFFQFRGRIWIIGLVAAATLLPASAVVTGLLATISQLGGVETRWAATLPGVFSAFGLFVYFAAMRRLPASVLQAARLDGAGDVAIWWTIVLPAVRPATSVFVLLHFLSAWNALLWPATVLASVEKQPVAVGLESGEHVARLRGRSVTADGGDGGVARADRPALHRRVAGSC